MSIVVIVVVNFSYFHLLLQNHWANFNQTWHKAFFGDEDWSLFKWKGPPFSRRNNYEIAKIHWIRKSSFPKNTLNLKIFFSKTMGQFQPNLNTKHPLVKGIQVCSNEETFNSHKVNIVFFLQHLSTLWKSYVFIDKNCFLRWEMWPMASCLLSMIPCSFICSFLYIFKLNS